MKTQNNFNPKSFWERPEGTTGMVVAVAAGIAAVYGFAKALPWLITLFENTLYLTVLGVALFALGWVLLDRRVWALTGYLYRSVMRWITGLFIQLDPIGILKSYAEDMRRALGRMDRQIADLRGQMRQLQQTMDSNEQEMGKALQMVGVARQQDRRGVVVLKSRQAGRLRESNLTLQALYAKMETLYRVLVKMHESSALLVEDIEAEVDVKSRERAAILASHSAFRQAMKIVRGDGDKKALFDQTLEYLADDYGQKLGEIEHFVTMSASFIDSVDLQNGIYEEDALRMIEAWERNDESLLLGNTKRELVSAPAGGAVIEHNPQPANGPNRRRPDADSYRSLFGEPH
ncbi:hypothetical protein [Chitinimonas sp.]|uniref:hypothetical protein n=1 Tax=Chitinimonas sp. TaxID=1934313 RepID=UPI0035AE6852